MKDLKASNPEIYEELSKIELDKNQKELLVRYSEFRTGIDDLRKAIEATEELELAKLKGNIADLNSEKETQLGNLNSYFTSLHDGLDESNIDIIEHGVEVISSAVKPVTVDAGKNMAREKINEFARVWVNDLASTSNGIIALGAFEEGINAIDNLNHALENEYLSKYALRQIPGEDGAITLGNYEDVISNGINRERLNIRDGDVPKAAFGTPFLRRESPEEDEIKEDAELSMQERVFLNEVSGEKIVNQDLINDIEAKGKKIEGTLNEPQEETDARENRQEKALVWEQAKEIFMNSDILDGDLRIDEEELEALKAKGEELFKDDPGTSKDEGFRVDEFEMLAEEFNSGIKGKGTGRK